MARKEIEVIDRGGAKTVAKLHLTQYAYKNTIINPETMNKK